MKKRTIVHIVPKFLFGGAERLVALYAHLHDYSKFDVHAVACVEDGKLRELFNGSEAQVFAASRATYGGRFGAWKALRDYLDEIEPDVVHTHLLTSDVIGWFYRLRAKKKPLWISSQHNVEDSRPWLYRKIWRFILPQADAVVAVAPRVYDYAHNNFGVSKKRLHLVLNGIDVKKWAPASKVAVRQTDTLHIGTIGRFEPQKGHTYGLKALARIPAHIDWQYHLFGGGYLEEELRAEAAALGIADRIVWHGVVDDMEQRISSLDVVFQPSLFEGLSLVILEALTAGRIVFTTPAGGEGVIEHGKTGYLVESYDDIDAMATGLTYIAEHTAAGVKVAAAAAKMAKSRFDIADNVAALEALYRPTEDTDT